MSEPFNPNDYVVDLTGNQKQKPSAGKQGEDEKTDSEDEQPLSLMLDCDVPNLETLQLDEIRAETRPLRLAERNRHLLVV